MKLEGTLDTFPLRELIDMIIYSSVTGVLQIDGPGEGGRLFFRESSLYHVERGAAHGVAALGELFELSYGSFCFVSKETSPEESLTSPVSAHLERAERLGARWRQIRRYVPTLDLFPRLLGNREAAMRRVSPLHYPLLDGIDGVVSLRQLAARCSWDEIDVAEAAAQLSLDGVIDLRRDPDIGTGPPLERAPRGDGLFDRVRARAGLPQRPAGAEAGRQPPGAAPSGATPEDLILQLLRDVS